MSSCLTVRRELLTTPAALSPEAREHIQGCEACRRYSGEQARFDRQLAQAMQVPVPEHLGASVIFERSTRNRRARRWFAAAAVALLTLTGTATVLLNSGELHAVAPASLVAHMAHDPIHETQAWPQAAGTLEQVNRGVGVQLAALPGTPVAARICDVDSHRASHFVVERDGARATAFVMPGEFSPGDEYVEVDGRTGRLISTPGGMIAVFCPERRVLEQVSQELLQTVQWGGV